MKHSRLDYNFDPITCLELISLCQICVCTAHQVHVSTGQTQRVTVDIPITGLEMWSSSENRWHTCTVWKPWRRCARERFCMLASYRRINLLYSTAINMDAYTYVQTETEHDLMPRTRACTNVYLSILSHRVLIADISWRALCMKFPLDNMWPIIIWLVTGSRCTRSKSWWQSLVLSRLLSAVTCLFGIMLIDHFDPVRAQLLTILSYAVLSPKYYSSDIFSLEKWRGLDDFQYLIVYDYLQINYSIFCTTGVSKTDKICNQSQSKSLIVLDRSLWSSSRSTYAE